MRTENGAAETRRARPDGRARAEEEGGERGRYTRNDCATAFSIFNAYVLRPIAVRDPSSLVQMSWVDRGGNWHVFTWNDYQALRTNREALAED